MSELRNRREEIKAIARAEGCTIARTFKRFVDAWEGKLPENMSDEMTRQMRATLDKQFIAVSSIGLMGKELRLYSREMHAGAKDGLAELFRPYLEQ